MYAMPRKFLLFILMSAIAVQNNRAGQCEHFDKQAAEMERQSHRTIEDLKNKIKNYKKHIKDLDRTIDQEAENAERVVARIDKQKQRCLERERAPRKQQWGHVRAHGRSRERRDERGGDEPREIRRPRRRGFQLPWVWKKHKNMRRKEEATFDNHQQSYQQRNQRVLASY